MHNNTNSIVYFHTQNTNHYDSMCNICTNIGLNLFDCQKIDDLSYIINNFTPMYLVVDIDNSFDKHIVQELISHNIKPIMFIIDNFDIEIRNNNIFKVNNFDSLYNLIYNHHKFYCSHMLLPKIDLAQCYYILTQELDNLFFRQKLIGYKYFTELIYELYTSAPTSNYKCNEFYNEISKKYNTNSSCIERAIRYSIFNAYQNSTSKKSFLNISKTSKIPTIKEMANYILDKVMLKISNIA